MTAHEPSPRQTILVVDDTPGNVTLLLDLLKGLWRVKVAASGARALEVAASADPPDLILLDVMMPEMDGYEVCRQLKRNPATREIPVLFLTARNEAGNEARGFAAGAADYITKPFSAALVLARVRPHLEQRRLLAVERELLERTLKGSLGTILELIALASPHSSEWSQRLAELAEEVARQMGVAEPWMVGLAGALSRIGTLVVPEPVLEKIRSGAILNTEEREAYGRVPEVGYRLLKEIPRLEAVAEMIHYSQKNFNGGGFPLDEVAGEQIPMGGRILRVCLDLLNTTSGEQNPTHRISVMLCNFSFYDARVTLVLKKILEEGFLSWKPAEPGTDSRLLLVRDLQVGQVLDRSIETFAGQMLLRQGTVLRPGHLEKLANYALIGAIRDMVAIQV